MGKYNILSTSPTFAKYSSHAARLLEENNCFLEVIPLEDVRSGNFMAKLEKADGWIVGIDKVRSDHLRRAPNLKVIAKHGTGVDGIDRKTAAERGIIVANSPGSNALAVAELTVGLIIGSARQLVYADKATRNGIWKPVMGGEMSQKTLGLIGLGSIGRRIVELIQGFDMRILGFDVYRDSDFERKHNVVAASVQEILTQSDYVSLHVPLTDSTRHMIGASELSLMKETSYLINTCRGGVIDEEALYDALSNKVIAGAALDVFQVEPPLKSRLFGLDNVIVTPHMGAYTREAMARTSDICANNVVNVLTGRPPLYEVKYDPGKGR